MLPSRSVCSAYWKPVLAGSDEGRQATQPAEGQVVSDRRQMIVLAMDAFMPASEAVQRHIVK